MLYSCIDNEYDYISCISTVIIISYYKKKRKEHVV